MFFPASLVGNDDPVVASLAIGNVVQRPALSDVALVMYDVHSSDLDVAMMSTIPLVYTLVTCMSVMYTLVTRSLVSCMLVMGALVMSVCRPVIFSANDVQCSP